MRMNIFFVEILIYMIYFTSIAESKCVNSHDCSSHGICISGTCDCDKFYSGSNCSDSWRTDSSWVALFWTQAIVTGVANTLFDSWIVFQLFITFRYAKEGKWKVWNVTTIALITYFFGCLFRVVEFFVDPFRYRNIFCVVCGALLYDFGLIFIFVTGMMVFLYWLELHNTLHPLVFVSKYRPALIIFVFSIIVLISGTDIWWVLSNNQVAGIFYNCFIALFVIVIIGVSTWGSYSLLKATKSSAVQASGSSKQFTIKLLRFIILSDILWVVCALSVIVATMSGAYNEKWPWLGVMILYRIEEFINAILFLWFIRKKIPKAASLNDNEPTSRIGTKSGSSVVALELSSQQSQITSMQ